MTGLALIAAGLYGSAVVRLREVSEHLRPVMERECAPPQKPARVYPLEEQV